MRVILSGEDKKNKKDQLLGLLGHNYKYITLLLLYCADYIRRTANRIDSNLIIVSTITSGNRRLISSVKKATKRKNYLCSHGIRLSC